MTSTKVVRIPAGDIFRTAINGASAIENDASTF
jgi:hypothetical protein